MQIFVIALTAFSFARGLRCYTDVMVRELLAKSFPPFSTFRFSGHKGPQRGVRIEYGLRENVHRFRRNVTQARIFFSCLSMMARPDFYLPFVQAKPAVRVGLSNRRGRTGLAGQVSGQSHFASRLLRPRRSGPLLHCQQRADLLLVFHQRLVQQSRRRPQTTSKAGPCPWCTFRTALPSMIIRDNSDGLKRC